MSETTERRIGIFLDRDGVINEDVHFLRRLEDLRFVPRAVDALVMLADAFPPERARIVVVSNQSALGRGMIGQDDFHAFTQAYFEALRDASGGAARIDGYRYCPHHPTEGVDAYRTVCACRKPEPGMLLEAAAEQELDLARSYMVGDKRSDVLAGQAAGAFSILVRTGCGGEGGRGDLVTPDAVCDDLYAAAQLILLRTRIEAGP